MTDFAGNIVGIKNGLLTMLQAMQLDGEDAFALATDDPSAEFDQEPYALIIPNDISDEHVEVGVNDYTIPFIIVIVLSLEKGVTSENEPRTQPQTYDYMYNLVELTLNAIDQADWTDALNTNTGLSTYLLDTSRVQIRPADSKGGAVLIARIDTSIKYQWALYG